MKNKLLLVEEYKSMGFRWCSHRDSRIGIITGRTVAKLMALHFGLTDRDSIYTINENNIFPTKPCAESEDKFVKLGSIDLSGDKR